MRYYTIQGKNILIADKESSLTKFYENVFELPTDYEVDKYIVDNSGQLTPNPDWEQEQAEKEAQRIGNLQVTKRVFMLGLQQMGITYAQLKELLATNEQAQMEWELCVELQRKNPLLDLMAGQFGVTSATLDYIFRKANGEDVEPPVSEEL